MNEVQFEFIPKPSGRRLAISDIHGCYKTFSALLNQLALSQDDQLFILGDAINRGPGSSQVLDQIMQLKQEGYAVYLIRGNHEQLILNAQKKSAERLKRTTKMSNSEGLVKDDKLFKKYRKLLKHSYHYLVLDEYYLVHAGFDFSKELPFENVEAMMHIKQFKAKKKFLDGKKVVVGHSPKKLGTILKRIKKGKRKLFIDNGCVNEQTEGQGNLLCLNLDTLTISIQPNLEA